MLVGLHNIVMSIEHVHLFVSFSVCIARISGTICPNFAKFSMLVAYDHGLILPWCRCNTLCISSFTNGII